MKRTQLFPILIALAALLALCAGLSTAQDPLSETPGGPQSAGETQALVGNAFTYQGELRKDGSPINATCAMTFTLYDDGSAGSPVGSPIKMDVAVANGLFTVQLDFADHLTGAARWLAVAVKCPGDAAASTLDPRQELTAAPYAISLRPGAVVSGAVTTAVLRGENTSASGSAAYGVYGITHATNSVGVRGYAVATSGTTYGLAGRVDSPTGQAVRGWAAATTGTNYGVYGISDSTDGRGVFGIAGAATGNGQGVRGESASSTNGVGVYGYGTATSGTNYGVFGRSASPDGYGVYGVAPNTGVWGRATATFGTVYGVYGEGRVGVYGEGSLYGVRGSSVGTGVSGTHTGTGGIGVHGYTGTETGESYAIAGFTNSADAWAGYFSTSYGNGVRITSNAGKIGLVVAGGSKSAVVATADGARLLYNEESTEVWFTDYGFGQLVDGSATVAIDPIYAQTVNLDEPYLVFVTPQGDCGLYVTDRTATSFTVRALDGRTCNMAFDYRIVAKRLGFEGMRLERAPWADNDPVLYPEADAPAPLEP